MLTFHQTIEHLNMNENKRQIFDPYQTVLNILHSMRFNPVIRVFGWDLTSDADVYTMDIDSNPHEVRPPVCNTWY